MGVGRVWGCLCIAQPTGVGCGGHWGKAGNTGLLRLRPGKVGKGGLGRWSCFVGGRRRDEYRDKLGLRLSCIRFIFSPFAEGAEETTTFSSFFLLHRGLHHELSPS